MSSPQDLEAGKQRVPQQSDMQGLWKSPHRRGDHHQEGPPEGEGDPPTGFTIQLPNDEAQSSVSSGGGGRAARLSGVSTVATAAPGNVLAAASGFIQEDSMACGPHRGHRSHGVLSLGPLQETPSGQSTTGSKDEPALISPRLRHNMVGHLKRNHGVWQELHTLLTMEHPEPLGTPLKELCDKVGKAIQKNSAQLRIYKELFGLETKQLRKVVELCNPGCFNQQVDYFGLRRGQVFDIVLGWDLLDKQVQEDVKAYLRSDKPGLILLAPPCTLFSTLQQLSIRLRHPSAAHFDEHLKELRRARLLLKFCVEICELCHELGLHYVFEHPWGASSWSEPCLKRLLQRTDNYLARVDQCQFGLMGTSGQPMRKRSGFLTNHRAIAEKLNVTCDGSHDHETIIGRAPGDPSNRSRMAQAYPSKLIACILSSYAASLGISRSELHWVDASTIISQDQQLWNKFQLNSSPPLLALPGRVGEEESPQVGDALPHQVGEEECRGDWQRNPWHQIECHAMDDQDEETVEAQEETRESFPGSHPLSLPALVKRAHEGLGHPGKDRFLRILKHSKASEQVLKIAKELKCSVCERFKRPRPSRAGAPPREVGLNEIVGVDTIQMRAFFHRNPNTA